MTRCPECGAPRKVSSLEESKKIVEEILAIPLPAGIRRKLKESRDALRRELTLTPDKRERLIR